MTDSQNPYGDSVEYKDEKPRCWRCQRLLAEMLTRPWVVTCPRCKARNSTES